MMRSLVEHLVTFFSWIAGLLLMLALLILVGYLLKQGGNTLNLNLIFGDTAPMDALLLRQQVFDGLFPAIAGTLLLIAGSMLIAIPVGIAAGIYMAEYCSGRIKSFFSLLFDILAGVPSIVVGLAGLSLTIFLHRHLSAQITTCLLISCLSLALLVLPYLIRTTQTALESIDPLIRRTAPALGASRLQNIVRVLLPNSISDIVGGIILATGRCTEDTAVIMLTGAVATAGLPRSIFGQYEALPFYIYYISSQYTGPDELARGFGAAILLLILCAGLLLSALWMQRRLTTLLLYR
ncbi:MAG: ABC transporter permease subunit [Desulfobulbaceae bacterium]|nr:ABC transporter permease subunit [Desulfobulbaceae bacterium]